MIRPCASLSLLGLSIHESGSRALLGVACRSYCYRYRVSARAPNTKDSTAQNTGCRCGRDAGPAHEEEEL